MLTSIATHDRSGKHFSQNAQTCVQNLIMDYSKREIHCLWKCLYFIYIYCFSVNKICIAVQNTNIDSGFIDLDNQINVEAETGRIWFDDNYLLITT